jgi:Fe2+ or Zn2+ uptake regulation protein
MSIASLPMRTTDELMATMRAEMPTISLKTVYQTVHDLEDLGEVRPAPVRSVTTSRPHKEQRCRS